MIIKFKKLDPNAVVPTLAHADDAGYDLVATSKILCDPPDILEYGTGLAIEIPSGFVGLIMQRSSVYKHCLTLVNAVGVIDSGFTGEIKLKFKTIYGTERFDYKKGDKIGQLLIMPLARVTFSETDELKQSSRGTGGYGSTGA